MNKLNVYCRSLSPLFDNSKLDKELRSMIRENFREFCSAEGKSSMELAECYTMWSVCILENLDNTGI